MLSVGTNAPQRPTNVGDFRCCCLAAASFLRDCILFTGGGWREPPTNATNLCPTDVYTRPCKLEKGNCPGWSCSNITTEIDRWLCSAPCTPSTSLVNPCPWVVHMCRCQCHIETSPFPAAALTSAVHLHSHFTLLALLILRLPHSHPRAATMIVGFRCTPLATPCLFNVVEDIGERDNIAAENPDIVRAMSARLTALSADFWHGDPLPDNGKFCEKMQERGGYVGPWLSAQASDPVS